MISNDELQRAATQLGTLPTSLHRLMAITASPEFDFAEIVDVVDHDMLLTAAILRRANSASSAPVDHIHTVRDAVVRIGAVQILATAVHSVVGGALQRELRCYNQPSRDLWRHSCAASIAATQIRSKAAIQLPTSTGTTALLHDVGKIVLDVVAVDQGLGPIEVFGMEACAVEVELFGIDHAAAGAFVAEMWHLPQAIVEGIAGHHTLIDNALPSAICLADVIAHLAAEDLPEGLAADLAQAAESARQILGISTEQLNEIVGSTRGQLGELLERFDSVPA